MIKSFFQHCCNLRVNIKIKPNYFFNIIALIIIYSNLFYTRKQMDRNG